MEQNCYLSIASGSSGNCSLYIAGNTRILIDLGVSVRRLTAALRRMGLTIDMLDAVLPQPFSQYRMHHIRCNLRQRVHDKPPFSHQRYL